MASGKPASGEDSLIARYFRPIATDPGAFHLDTARLQTLGFSLRDVAAFLEGLEVFAAAFTEDEVKAAQARLPGPRR